MIEGTASDVGREQSGAEEPVGERGRDVLRHKELMLLPLGRKLGKERL